jgi:hypothetical protein
MDAFEERREALRLLAGLENGGMSASDAAAIAQDLDPVLVHVIVRFLRESYPASDPAATSVLDRVVQLNAAYRGLVAHCKEGERDPVTQWFENEHSYRDFRGRGAELVERIVDKLES